jgi:ParB-like chromosome segregation protein Spo0J
LRKVTVEEASKILNVSPRLISQAREIEKLNPEKAKQVEEGKKTIGQRATVGLTIKPMFEERAKERQGREVAKRYIETLFFFQNSFSTAFKLCL